MKNLYRILALCTVLAVMIVCATVFVSAETTVTPSNAVYTTSSICPHCNKTVDWTEISGFSGITASGHYVVNTSFTRTSTFNVPKDTTVVILVVGTVTFNGGQFRVGSAGTATTWLIGGGGTFQGGATPEATYNPSMLGVYDSGKLNIIGDLTFQGTETEPLTVNRGGLINVNGTGVANIYGGTFNGYNLDSTNTGSYAGIYLRGGGTLHMYGGTVNGGSAKYGNTVYVANGTFDMEGGTINGGTSTGSGGAIYLAKGSVTLTGTAQVKGGACTTGGVAYLSSGTMDINGSAQITGSTANYGGIIYNNAGTLNISGSAQLSGGNANNYGGAIYTKSTTNISGGTIQGGTATHGGAIGINGGPVVISGGTISGGTASVGGGAIYLHTAAGEVTIQDSASISGGNAVNGGTVYIAGGTFTMNGGTVGGGTATNGNTTADNGNGGSFYLAGGTVSFNGGTVTAGSTVKGTDTDSKTVGAYGGTIYAISDFTIDGATIHGGSGRYGGAIFIKAAALTINGGTINGNATSKAISSGGAIFASADSTVTMGSSTKNPNGATINGSTVSTNGGAIYISDKATLNINCGTINGGHAAIGAALYATGSAAKINMTGGTINGGTIDNQGTIAGVYSGATLNVSGGVLSSTIGGESGIRVQGSAKVYLHGDALVKAGAGYRDALDVIGNSSTPATLVLAGNARVGNLDGEKTTNHNINLLAYTDTNSGVTNYPRLRVANDWTGYAAFTANFGSTASGNHICTATTDSTTKYYAQCGTWDAATTTFTQGGTFESTNLIHGSADEGDLPVFGEEGKLMLPRAKAVADGTTTWYRISDKAVDAASSANGYAVLYADDTTPITIDAGVTACVDFNGCNATVSGGGILQGLDSSALTTGQGDSVVTIDGVTVEKMAVRPAGGETFIPLVEENTATFHAIYAKISKISIRPGTVGMYYTSDFICDDSLKNYIDSYGVAVSLAGMPDKNFATNNRVLYTAKDGESFTSGEHYSVIVQYIMNAEQSAASNKSRGEKPIYANAYIKLTVDGTPYTVMASSTSQYSLMNMLRQINTYWDTFAEDAQDSLATKVYDPYIRNFEDGDWDLYNLRIQANGGYTAEEEAILEARRQTVMDYMRESVSTLWRSDKTLTYGLGNTARDNGASFTIVEGRLYKGLPYVYGNGSQDSFLEYAASQDENGIYTISGLNATALNYESYGGRVGNDCSGAVTNAWSQISPSLTATVSSACAPYFGVVPVGNYNFNSPINPSTHRILDTAHVTESNGEQVMYEAYAMLEPGDAAYHQEYPSTRGNHIRMVVKVDVVRNADGTINGTSSTITMLEQTRTQINANKTEKHPVTGETIYVIGGVDRTYKFSTLFSEHYIPVTVAELRDPTPLEETWVADTLEEDTIENLFTGSVTSNRYIDAVKITIFDESGNTLQEVIGYSRRGYDKDHQMSRFITEKPGSMKGSLDLDALKAGNYRCTVTARLTIDDDYIHTVRDFTFSK